MTIKTIDASGLKEKMKKSENIVLIDCREIDEWNSGHIKGAQFMPLSNFSETSKKLENKNAEIVIQCRSGVRSMKACEYLESQGFTNLTNLAGGILGWTQNGYDITQE